MKAAFDIFPDVSGTISHHLLIETGSYGISLLWFTKDPFKVAGVATYNFPDDEIVMNLQTILKSVEGLLNQLLSVTICYDFKKSILVPAQYDHSSVHEETLSLVYGEVNNAAINKDFITSANIYNYYSVPKEVHSVLSGKFPAATVFHSSSLQLELLNNTTGLLYCILFHNVLKVILYKEGKLQIVQQFNYRTPEDVLYHLLNVCERHHISPSESELRLTGMIDEHSKLYMELYQYFLNITFENPADTVYTSPGFKNFPAHFFSHLTALASCVL